MNENRVVVCFGYDLLVPIYTQKFSEGFLLNKEDAKNAKLEGLWACLY